MNENDVLEVLDLDQFGHAFAEKPIVVGGLAMEYYGLRKRGTDVDLIIGAQDYQDLDRRFPGCRKDVWGDFGLLIGTHELFRSMYKFDSRYYAQGSLEFSRFRMVGIDMLFRMKVYAQDADDKHKEDVKRLRAFFDRDQNQDYLSYMNRHIDRYVGSKTGIFEHVDYSDRD